MKPSHLQTPRTLNECIFVPGYQSASVVSTADRIGGYLLALTIGIGLAALLVAWWSS